MKNYTILEALKEIDRTMPFDVNAITSILYEDGSKCRFVIIYAFDKNYFIDLDNGTYKLIN